jgi:Ca2+-binding EF-hand superfamily protein
MRRFLFAALGLALCVALLHSAGPPSVARAADEAADEDDGVQDVLYVGKPHPVLIRLKLTVGNKSAFTHYDEVMAKYFAFLDRNGNKTLDKIEASKAPSAQQMLQFFQGNILAVTGRGNNPNVAAVPFTDLDEDRDGKVTLEEFKAYYLKNGAGPIAMAASSAPAFNGPQDALADAVFNLLDVNKDGKLSRAEIEACEQTLMKYDADDDEMISLEEVGLATRNRVRRRIVAQKRPQPKQPQQAPQETNLYLIGRDTGKQRAGKNAVARELIAKYDKDKDGALSREEIGFPKDLFDAIDRNKDGKLNLLELSRWLSGKPAGDFTIRMQAQGGPVKQAMKLPATKQEEMLVALGGVRINVVPQVAFGLGRNVDSLIMQQFKYLDEDKKGFITRKQVEANGQQAQFMRTLFDMGDRNNDARLSEAELKALLENLNMMRGAQLTLSIYSTGSGLFQALDANGDGMLSLREMRNAWKRLEKLDVNKDGYITRDEFPTQFQLTISQGANVANGMVAVQPGMEGQGGGPRPRVRGPIWFVKMDRNGDGDVSRSEWLGSKEDFDAIDTDHDGLISLEEAEAYDAKMRKATDE